MCNLDEWVIVTYYDTTGRNILELNRRRVGYWSSEDDDNNNSEDDADDAVL